MINPNILQNISLYYNSNSQETELINNITYKTNVSDSVELDISFSKEIFIPLSIIQSNSSLEAIVLYLKEILKLKYSEIALLLNRNQRTIWATYANAKKKNIVVNLENDSGLTLPLSIFVSRNFSVLETIVFYLRINQALSFNQISSVLGKNYRTIWTIYRRSLKKLTKKNKK